MVFHSFGEFWERLDPVWQLEDTLGCTCKRKDCSWFWKITILVSFDRSNQIQQLLCLDLPHLKLRKSVFHPEGQNSLFTFKSKPKFQIFRIMSKMYFLKSRFYVDHFSLLRWVHPKPRNSCFGPKRVKLSFHT